MIGLADNLFMSAMVLAVLGWCVPKALSVVFPEGVRPLMLLAFVSACALFVLSALYFIVLYVAMGAPLADITAGGLPAVIAHFGRLGLVSALFWAPIMILTVANLPRHWREETW